MACPLFPSSKNPGEADAVLEVHPAGSKNAAITNNGNVTESFARHIQISRKQSEHETPNLTRSKLYNYTNGRNK